jgi:hypothetical protein
VIPRLSAVTALLLMVFVVDATAQKSRPARPAGKSITVEVMRGGSVRIPLRGYERNLNRLEYGIIGSPGHGRLSRVEQYDGPERQGPGYVTYTHGNDEDSTTDTFAFEVRAPLTKMTGRGRITIRIIDALAQLRITPATLDFGATAIGDAPVSLSVELANVGGGFIQGVLEVPEPFALANDGMFVLRRGEKTRIPVIFAPQSAGPYVFPIQPVPSDPALLTLRGEAKQPFAVEAASSIFEEQPDGSRTARATVTYQSQSPQQISVVVPPEVPIEPVPPLDLAPGEAADVTLRIPSAQKTNVAPFSVRFESAAHTVALDFQAPPIPPELFIVSTPDFGAVKPGTAARAALVLSNAGGAVAQCRLQSGKNLTTVDGATAFFIAPGAVHNVALKLIPKKDQDLPTSVMVTFRERELSIPIAATWIDEPPVVIVCDLSKEPPPTVAELELNKGIKLERKNGTSLISYLEQTGWTSFTLQNRSSAAAGWQNYQIPTPDDGLFDWIKNLARRIRKFFDTPIQRQQVPGMEADERWIPIEIAAEEVGGPNTWRLIAIPSGESIQRPVSEEFQIKSGTLVPAAPSRPVPQNTPQSATPATPSPPPQTLERRNIGPVTEIASAGTRPERNAAVVQVAFDSSLGIRGFRLERGAMIAQIDPKTGIPQAPRFEKIDPPEAEVEYLGLAEGEADGKKFTICTARISELQPGSRTYWRVVPEKEKGALPPTTVMPIHTLPRPPFPWNNVLLGALVLLLVGVLYLRWRMNRPPA